MSEPEGTIIFKEWLPDLPALDNPGLVEAQNCRPIDLTYKSYPTLGSAISGTLASLVPRHSIRVHDATPSTIVYTGDETSLSASTSGAFTELSASTYGVSDWDFAIFDDIVCAAAINVPIQGHTIGSAGNFATLGSAPGTAPAAFCIGVVNQFLVAGWPDQVRNRVRWSAINNIQSWPTANSATAIAAQSGQQDLPDWGGVRAIGGGDQYAIIWQPSGMHRMTYIGGSAVFQFDVISKNIGTAFKHSIIQYNGIWYFASPTGFFATNGAEVVPIGAGKVDRYFLSVTDRGRCELEMKVAADPVQGLIYWAYPYVSGAAGSGGSYLTDEILIYNVAEKRWTRAVQVTRGLIPANTIINESIPLYGFRSDARYAQFDGTVGSAVFTTGEVEWARGLFSRVGGVKPLVDQAVATVAIGTRNDQTSAASFTAETTANSRTGFCDFRSEARYHRARLTVTGTFNAARGLEVDAEVSGET